MNLFDTHRTTRLRKRKKGVLKNYLYFKNKLATILTAQKNFFKPLTPLKNNGR